MNIRRQLSIIVLLFLLVFPAFAQEATPAHTVEPTDAPAVIVEQPLAADNLLISPETLTMVLAVIAFAGLLIRSALDYRQNGNLLQSYGSLVQGIVGNAGLTDAFGRQYGTLTPEQRRYADLALDLVDTLSRVTPTTIDDALQEWTGRVRARVLKPPTGQG